MFIDRTINAKIDALHYCTQKIVCRGDESSFEEQVRRDKSAVTVHHKNIHFLAIELYQVKHEISPPFMAEIFKCKIKKSYLILSYLR